MHERGSERGGGPLLRCGLMALVWDDGTQAETGFASSKNATSSKNDASNECIESKMAKRGLLKRIERV